MLLILVNNYTIFLQNYITKVLSFFSSLHYKSTNQKIKLKKLSHFLILLLFCIILVPTNSFATLSEKPLSEITKEIPAEVQVKLDRLNEIKAMDKSELTRVEKKALRKEVRETKAFLKSSGNGLYLSVGAIIIIILLLILLL